MSSFSVRKFERSDFEHTAKLAKLVYGHGPLTDPAYLEWKYSGNPSLPSILAIAESQGELIGFNALLPVLVKVENTVALCAIASDTMVHPEFRRQGVFLAMQKYLTSKAENISMTYSSGARLRQPTAIGTVKHFQWRVVGPVFVLERFLSPGTAMKQLWVYPQLNSTNLFKYLKSLAGVGAITLLGSLTQAVARGLKEDERKEQGIQVTEMKPLVFGAEFDNLWEEVKDSFRIAVVRNKEYLNWRFSNPTATYKGFRADQDGRLRGYCILSYTAKGNLKTALVADVLATEPGIAATLVDECARYAKRDQAHILKLCKTEQLQDFIGSLGLVRSAKDYHFARLDNSHIPESLAFDITNWYLTFSDRDSM